MSLREQAAADVATILEDVDDFGWPVTVTAPGGSPTVLVGFTNDVAAVIDPDTGIEVTGRKASVVLRIASLTSAGLGLPKGIQDATSAPWLVSWTDVDGTVWTFKVTDAHPDLTVGIVVCHLEGYQS